jgi:hypothetical protein
VDEAKLLDSVSKKYRDFFKTFVSGSLFSVHLQVMSNPNLCFCSVVTHAAVHLVFHNEVARITKTN